MALKNALVHVALLLAKEKVNVDRAHLNVCIMFSNMVVM
jgi:hypothetical protein